MVYSLSKLGIVDLNAMQQDMLEHVRKEASIVLLSATGSGKTLAYLLPLLELLNAETQEVKALVLVPSRELAQQTQSVLKQLSSEVRCVACYGGRPAMDEHRIIRELHPHVIIGTPGRILDHIDKRNFLTEYVETLVIDEFDKCLELGFRQQMSAILSELKNVRKRILLSATDSPGIPAFTGVESYRRLDYLDKSEQVPERIAVSIVHSPEKDKLQTLLNLVCVLGQQSSLVFVNYRESV
ncbi:MAG: DEAD/DEAH box helicase, partial [Bacteroidaceae bacterium]|nr:DEAD/DEAH box helicase [Bacteroidaceae bacterium]